MKRFLKLFPALILIFAMMLTACGQPATDTSSTAEETSSETASVEETSSEAVSEETSSEETVSKEPEKKVARLQNTYKLLTEDKKLTIGYIGGSITAGGSAKKVIENGKVKSESGSVYDNYVHRTSKWISSLFPDAEIETINAGISDTTTGFALYRYVDHMMNDDGHDIPDLVFVEFTSNDGANSDAIATHLESLVRGILDINPYCEIVFISTTVNDNTAKATYQSVAQHYGFLCVDVGKPLQEAKTARGAGKEADGTLYYTVDNLHPSAEGYALYLEKIAYLLEYHLTEGTGELVNRKDMLPADLKGKFPLIDEPFMISADKFEVKGSGQVINTPLQSAMYGMKETAVKENITESYMLVNTGDVITVKFTGTSVGMIIGLQKADTEVVYSIDGGEAKSYIVSTTTNSGQRYDHNKAIMFDNNLSEGEHTLTLEIKKDNVRIGAILVNGKQ